MEETTDRVRDVTGEYVDNAARASTLEATRAQLQSSYVESGPGEGRPAGPARTVVCRPATRGAEGDDAALVRASVSIDAAAHALEARPVAAAASFSSCVVAVEDRATRVQETVRRTQRLADGVIYLFVFAAPLALVALLVVAFCGVPLRARLADLADFSSAAVPRVCNSLVALVAAMAFFCRCS